MSNSVLIPHDMLSDTLQAFLDEHSETHTPLLLCDKSGAVVGLTLKKKRQRKGSVKLYDDNCRFIRDVDIKSSLTELTQELINRKMKPFVA